MLRRLWHPAAGFFVVLCLLLLYGGQTRFFQDPGTFWHIVVGQRILSSGRLMHADEFTYTRAGTPWSPFQWLGECGMAVLHRAGGWDLLLLAGVTLLAAVYSYLAWRLIQAGLHWLWAAGIVALVVGVSTPHFHLRPHLPTIAFTAATFELLAAVEAGRLRLRWLGLLLPLFALWTNLHGGVLGGYGMVGLAVAGWCCSWLLGFSSPVRSWKEAGGLILLAAVCPFTALASPYGAEVPRTWLWIMQSRIVPLMVREHAPLDPASGVGVLAVLLAGLYLVVLASTWPRGPRITWLLPLVWGVLSWSRGRHLPLFAVTAGLGLAEMLPFSRLAGRLLEWRESEEATAFPWPALLPPAALVLLAALLQVGGVRIPVVGAGWGHPDPGQWPVDLVDELRRAGEERTQWIFNEYSQGGFLIYYTPKVPVFIDDRCEVMGEEFLREYFEAEQSRTPEGEPRDTAQIVRAWDRRWGFTLALVWCDSPFDHFFAHEPGWVEVGHTARARLYRRE